MELEVISDMENKLLGRREIECIFPNGSGKAKRNETVEAVASKLGVSPKSVYVVSLYGTSGKRSLKGSFYVYSKEEHAKLQLPKYILRRMGLLGAKETSAKKETVAPKPSESKTKPEGKKEEGPDPKAAKKK